LPFVYYARCPFASGKSRRESLRLERCVISGVAGRKLEKIARRGFRGLKAPKRACILHFNATILPEHNEKILVPLKKFFLKGEKS
jgi:hypothetical protein